MDLPPITITLKSIKVSCTHNSPLEGNVPVLKRNWGCFTHHPWQMVPLLSLRAGNSLTFSRWSQNLLFIGLNAFLPQDLCTCWPLIQMAVPRSLHSSYLHFLLIPSQTKLPWSPALTAHFKVQTPLSHPWPAPLAPPSLPCGDRKPNSLSWCPFV